MALSFRDRFFTPKVARAIVSPSAIALTGAGAALGILLTGGVGGAVVGAAALFAGRVAAAIPRAPSAERIDPFTLADPWRRLSADAVAARTQFADAVRRARTGPLRDRLNEIGERISSGVDDCWKIAQAGNALADARARIDTTGVAAELADVQATSDPANPITAQTIQALQSQLDTARRLDDTIAATRDKLRLLNARLDDAVGRSIELSVSTTGADELGGVADDVSSITTEMEALRQALEVTSADPGTAAAGSTG